MFINEFENQMVIHDCRMLVKKHENNNKHNKNKNTHKKHNIQRYYTLSEIQMSVHMSKIQNTKEYFVL